MLELDPRSGSSYTQGQDRGSVATQFQDLLFSTWVSFHPVPELVILNLSLIPPSSRTETQFDKGSYPKIQVSATQHCFFISDLWF